METWKEAHIAIHKRFISFANSADGVIASGLTTPLYLNDLTSSLADKALVKTMVYTELADELTIEPTCACGYLKQEGSLGLTTEKCSICDTVVQPLFERKIVPMVFLRKPKGVKKLILPILWTMMRKAFIVKKTFNPIMWIADSRYREYDKDTVAALEAIGAKRNYNWLIDNLELVIETLSNYKLLKGRVGVVDLLEVYKANKDRLLVDNIYLPNKSLFIIEKTSTGSYIDPNFTKVLDAAMMSMDIDNEENSVAKRMNMTARILDRLADFYKTYLRTMLSGKDGVFRAHVFSSKGVHSARLVITSITDAHNYDTVYLPWVAVTGILRTHILNKLLKRNWTMNDAQGFIQGHTYRTHSILIEIINELLSENRDECFDVLVQRFPTLYKGNILKLKMKVKTDPRDMSLSFSILIVGAQNAD